MILETEAKGETEGERERSETERRRRDGRGYLQTGRRLTEHIAIDWRVNGCP